MNPLPPFLRFCSGFWLLSVFLIFPFVFGFGVGGAVWGREGAEHYFWSFEWDTYVLCCIVFSLYLL